MKRNILQFTDSFQQGGSEGQAAQLTALLSDSGKYNTFVATLDGTGVLCGEFEKMGLSGIVAYPLTSFRDLNFLAQLQRCVKFMRENKIEVVHSHGFYSNIFAMLAGFLARVPARVASKRETTGIRTRAQQSTEKVAFRLADVIVANAEAVRDALAADGVPVQKIQVIYNGLDASRVHSKTARQRFLDGLGIAHDEGVQIVTIVANFRLRVKDQATFLRAAREVLKDAPEALFLLAGEGPLLSEMRAFADELGLGRSARFLGQCDSVAELLAASDVCVLSSTTEGFSNSILEYMAAGKPVVVTDVGGARETVEDGRTGFIVPPANHRQMAARIVELLRDPVRAGAMGAAGRELVEQRFSTAERLSKTNNLYSRLLRRMAKDFGRSSLTVENDSN